MEDVKLSQKEYEFLCSCTKENVPVSANGVSAMALRLIYANYLSTFSALQGWYQILPKGERAITEYEVKQRESWVKDNCPEIAAVYGAWADKPDEQSPIAPAPDDVATLKARIIELEVNHASALEVSRIKGEALAEAVAENEAYRAALMPFAECVDYDTDLKTCAKYTGLRVLDGKSGTLQILVDEITKLTVGHLRAAAEVYAKFKGAGDE